MIMLFTEEQNNQIELNLEVLGDEVCLRQCQEECTELATAISHFLRPEKKNTAELLEETADVAISLVQVCMILKRVGFWGELKNHIQTGIDQIKTRTRKSNAK